MGYNYLHDENKESANVYDSLGDAHEKNDQPDLARENYKKAVELGEKQKHPNTDIYKKNLDRVSKTLDK